MITLENNFKGDKIYDEKWIETYLLLQYLSSACRYLTVSAVLEGPPALQTVTQLAEKQVITRGACIVLFFVEIVVSEIVSLSVVFFSSLDVFAKTPTEIAEHSNVKNSFFMIVRLWMFFYYSLIFSRLFINLPTPSIILGITWPNYLLK